MNRSDFDWIMEELDKRDKRLNYIVNVMLDNVSRRLGNIEKEVFGKKIKGSDLKEVVNGDDAGE